MYIRCVRYTYTLHILDKLILINLFMKTNIKTKTCMCIVHLSISTILIFTNGSKTQTKLGYLSLLDDLPSSSRLDPNRDPPSETPTSAMYDLDARALESPCESFQTPLLKLITN